MTRLTLAFIFMATTLTAAHAQNWPQFRGPAATGVAEGPARPVKFDASTSLNVRWKTPIPGLSHASPVVWGNKVFVVTAVNSAKDETRFGLFGTPLRSKTIPNTRGRFMLSIKQPARYFGSRLPTKGFPKLNAIRSLLTQPQRRPPTENI